MIQILDLDGYGCTIQTVPDPQILDSDSYGSTIQMATDP